MKESNLRKKKKKKEWCWEPALQQEEGKKLAEKLNMIQTQCWADEEAQPNTEHRRMSVSAELIFLFFFFFLELHWQFDGWKHPEFNFWQWAATVTLLDGTLPYFLLQNERQNSLSGGKK